MAEAADADSHPSGRSGRWSRCTGKERTTVGRGRRCGSIIISAACDLLLPPHPRGGLGWGVFDSTSPPPRPSPVQGEGEKAAGWLAVGRLFGLLAALQVGAKRAEVDRVRFTFEQVDVAGIGANLQLFAF